MIDTDECIDWDELFTSLPPEELDKLAILRIMECSNGIVQYMFRDEEEDALPIRETRSLMGFSMSSIKRMKIPLESETIEFAEKTKEVIKLVRDFYVRGMKFQDDDAYAIFLVASRACIRACGLERLQAAKDKLFAHCYAAPSYVWQWGLDYCEQFL